MLNRTIAPEIRELDEIKFIAPQKTIIGNHTSFIWMKDVPNATSRIDFYFDAGSAKGSNVISSLTAGLILAGTEQKSSTQIHNELDDLGAYFDASLNHEHSLLSFYALNDQMLSVIDLFEETIENASFPQHEIEELIRDRKQKQLINSEKVNFLAQRKFQQLIFDGTPYSRVIDVKEYDSVQQSEIVNYFTENYKKGLTKVVLVGDFTPNQVATIQAKIEKWCVKNTPIYVSDFENKIEKAHVAKDNALQSAIRIGKVLFNKKHPDYLSFVILNTILGDFFGSRLMKNIREDKGYTYGIGSYVNELKMNGYFVIGTEVGKDVCEAAIAEIKKEIELLQTDLVREEELSLVRNYLLGQTLKSADGPYALTDLFLTVEAHGLELNFYNDFIHTLKTITPETLRELAQKYLNWDSMTIVIAG
ncbi:MAG: insulinase family protein [Flavobacteriales bacterium]|nr:insulinase family protein [Crocinitomicaceae bacterium]NBX81152.1 insulinase family protein [Flavobacteriales bacterium]NCA19935.1 insulinase family protein [Crocinitomicaceae bacterium]